MIKKFITVIRENRSWLFLAVLFFAGGFIMSNIALQQNPEILTSLKESLLPVLEDLSEDVFSGSLLAGVATLFFHNLLATLQIMYLGIIIGFPPLISAIANGSVLGLVSFQVAQNGIAPLPFLLSGIIPHGVFELPAFFLSVGLGLKLGYHLLFPLPNLSRFDSLRKIFSEIGISLPFIALLLLIAAAVEVFITPSIISIFFNL